MNDNISAKHAITDEHKDLSLSKSIISPDSTPRNVWKSSLVEWENTPSPLRYNEAIGSEDKDLNTHEYEKDDSPILERTFYNPEPSAELIEQHLVDADNIGDTVFSKHWLLTTLMKLIKYVDENSLKTVSEKVDIDDEFQDELCKLWDMSMNQEVVIYLMECKSIDLLQGVITKSNAPRITEICIGILANMTCHPIVCEKICKDSDFILILLELFEEHDTPTLIELFRLLNVCLQSDDAKFLIEIFKQKTFVYMNVLFILQSSTSDVLLKYCAEFVAATMESDDDICKLWGNDELVLAIVEAIKQTGSHEGANLEPFLHTLQIFSTFESGLEALETYCGEIMILSISYLKFVSSDEVVVVDSKENLICYVLSIIKVLFVAWEGGVTSLFDDHHLVKSLLKILESVIPKFSRNALLNDESEIQCKNVNDKSNSSDKSPDNSDAAIKHQNQMISIIFGLLKRILCDIVGIMHQVTKSRSPANEKTDVISCPESLRFLDSCSRHLLNHLFDVLSTVEYKNYDGNNLELLSNSEQNSHSNECDAKSFSSTKEVDVLPETSDNTSNNSVVPPTNSFSSDESYSSIHLHSNRDESNLVHRSGITDNVSNMTPINHYDHDKNESDNQNKDTTTLNSNKSLLKSSCNMENGNLIDSNIDKIHSNTEFYLNLLLKDAMHYNLKRLSRLIAEIYF